MAIFFVDRISIRILSMLVYVVSAFFFFIRRQNRIPEETAYMNWVFSSLAILLILLLAQRSSSLIFSNPMRKRYFEPGNSPQRRGFVLQSVCGLIFCFPSNLFVNVIQQDYFINRIDLWEAMFVWCAYLIFLSDAVLIAFQKWSNAHESRH